jgi:hypothetical protein
MMSVDEACENQPCAGSGCSHDRAWHELVEENNQDADLIRETMLMLLLRAERGNLTTDHAPLLRRAVEFEMSRSRRAEESEWGLQAALMGAQALMANAGLVCEPGMSHVYLSTSCMHERHDYCASPVGSNGETSWIKVAGACKFCPARCICMCHRNAVT